MAQPRAERLMNLHILLLGARRFIGKDAIRDAVYSEHARGPAGEPAQATTEQHHDHDHDDRADPASDAHRDRKPATTATGRSDVLPLGNQPSNL